MPKLLMDVHMPIAVTLELQRRSIDCVTAQSLSLERFEDVDLLQAAHKLGRAVVTQDEDFLVIASDALANSTPHSGILYSRHTAISIGGLISDLFLIATCMEEAELADRVIYLPL